MIRALLIKTDSVIEEVAIENPRDAGWYFDGFVERVRVAPSVAMAIDESGLLKPDLPVNPIASKLYPGPTPIKGDVLLLHEGMTGSGMDIGIDWIDGPYDNLRSVLQRLAGVDA